MQCASEQDLRSYVLLGKLGLRRGLPAGVTATVYTTRPQSHLESEATFDPESLPPGMPRP